MIQVFFGVPKSYGNLLGEVNGPYWALVERGKKGEEKAKVFENRFRSGGEENDMRMENNVMRGRRVYEGYLVCLDLSPDLPGNGARNSSCYLLSMCWFSLEEERVMEQSSISISLSFDNQCINPVGGYTQIPRTYTNK